MRVTGAASSSSGTLRRSRQVVSALSCGPCRGRPCSKLAGDCECPDPWLAFDSFVDWSQKAGGARGIDEDKGSRGERLPSRSLARPPRKQMYVSYRENEPPCMPQHQLDLGPPSAPNMSDNLLESAAHSRGRPLSDRGGYSSRKARRPPAPRSLSQRVLGRSRTSRQDRRGLLAQMSERVLRAGQVPTLYCQVCCSGHVPMLAHGGDAVAACACDTSVSCCTDLPGPSARRAGIQAHGLRPLVLP